MNVVNFFRCFKDRKIIIIVCFITCIFISSCFCFADDTTIQETPQEGNIIIQSDSSVSVLRVSSSDTTGLHSLLLSLIGDYNPIVKDYTYTSNNGYVTHSIDIQPDWSWIMTCALFIVVIFCVFKLFGGVLSKI